MFVKYPHTPHLTWLGPGQPRGDKVLTREGRNNFLAGELIVEEKLDGANLGISIVADDLAVQNRGEYLRRPTHAQFSTLWPWLEVRRQALFDLLGERLVLFGEWCYAVHTVRYDALPDWFLGFDIYDREAARFWSVDRRNALLSQLGASSVAEIARGRYDLHQLSHTVATERSRYGSGPVEGIYLRRESRLWLEARAKIVRAEFTQTIQDHWSGRAIQRNQLRRADGVIHP